MTRIPTQTCGATTTATSLARSNALQGHLGRRSTRTAQKCIFWHLAGNASVRRSHLLGALAWTCRTSSRAPWPAAEGSLCSGGGRLPTAACPQHGENGRLLVAGPALTRPGLAGTSRLATPPRVPKLARVSSSQPWSTSLSATLSPATPPLELLQLAVVPLVAVAPLGAPAAQAIRAQ